MTDSIPKANVYARDEHTITRKNISEAALKVLYRLHKLGYDACLVGGAVRDLLLGGHPKDFDIATNATPEQVHKAFGNSRMIGRRFRIVHVRFGPEIIEVATYRGHGSEGDRELEEGRLTRDNVYGSIEEDALRRDFTVNALYYSIADFTVLDYVGGVADLNAGLIRMIGEPEERYREDPVRALRAARFAAKLGFDIAESTRAPIAALVPLLADIPPARLFDECLKLFMGGYGLAAFRQLRHLGLFAALFPATDQCLQDQGILAMVEHALSNTDQRIAEDKPVTPAFLIAVFLWPVMLKQRQLLVDQGVSLYEATNDAAEHVVLDQQQHTSVPRRFSTPAKEIWAAQNRLEGHTQAKPKKVMAHPRFRAAYDFLLLRVLAQPELQTQVEYWTEMQQRYPELAQSAARHKPKRGGRRPRRRKHPAKSASH